MQSAGNFSLELERGKIELSGDSQVAYKGKLPLRQLPRKAPPSCGDSQVMHEHEPQRPPRKKIKISIDNNTVSGQPIIPDTLQSNSDIEELVKTVSMVISAEIKNNDFWFMNSCYSHDFDRNHGIGLPSTEAPADSTDHGVSPKFKSDIVMAIELFASDLFCPYLILSKSRVGFTNCPRSDRVIISTLLAIEEMLIMNIIKQCPLSPPKKIHDSVKAILIASADRLAVVSSNFSADTFARASEGYWSQRLDFKFALMEADALSQGVLSDGTKCSDGEIAINKSSFNYAGQKHHLTGNSNAHSRKLIYHTHSTPSVPSPNAFAALLMEPDQYESHNMS